MKYARTVASSVPTLPVALGASPALAADGDTAQHNGPVRSESRGLSRDVSAALQRDPGLSARQVRTRGSLQAKAIELDKKLGARLGDALAGSIYKQPTGAARRLTARPAVTAARVVFSPIVRELPPRLEAVTRDPFLDRLDVSSARHRSADSGGDAVVGGAR